MARSRSLAANRRRRGYWWSAGSEPRTSRRFSTRADGRSHRRNCDTNSTARPDAPYTETDLRLPSSRDIRRASQRLNTHRSSTRDHIPGISATSTASKGPRPARPYCRITWSNRKLDHGRTAGSEPKDKSKRQRRFSTRPRRHSLLTRRNHQQPHHNHHRIQRDRPTRGRADRGPDHPKRLRLSQRLDQYSTGGHSETSRTWKDR